VIEEIEHQVPPPEVEKDKVEVTHLDSPA